MTSDEFVARYAARSHVTTEWLLEHRRAVPCDCHDPDCEGWIMVAKDDR